GEHRRAVPASTHRAVAGVDFRFHPFRREAHGTAKAFAGGGHGFSLPMLTGPAHDTAALLPAYRQQPSPSASVPRQPRCDSHSPTTMTARPTTELARTVSPSTDPIRTSDRNGDRKMSWPIRPALSVSRIARCQQRYAKPISTSPTQPPYSAVSDVSGGNPGPSQQARPSSGTAVRKLQAISVTDGRLDRAFASQ